MPFVDQNLRAPLLSGDIKPKVPGDLCFLEYSEIMQNWRTNPRWTTIHNEAKRLFGFDDTEAAKFLAFIEFYANHGHPYELEKKDQNGDV